MDAANDQEQPHVNHPAAETSVKAAATGVDAVTAASSNAAAQCPVPHAPSQPLPPGHPPTANGVVSTLKPPTDPRCVFFRTYEDLSQTPPLSRAASVQLDDLKRSLGAQVDGTEHVSKANPETTIVLASRNSQLALIQTSQVSALLTAHFGRYSPAFIGKASDSSSSNGISSTNGTSPPASPLPEYSSDKVEEYMKKAKALGIHSPVSFPFTSMSTGGDQNNASPLYVIGGEGRAIWTKELEVALAAGAVDAIVHCLKDVPTSLPENMMLGAILERDDPRDALIMKQGLPYKTLDELPPGSVIGTSSIRRVAQLRRRYPELVFSDVRGNVNTRFAKLDNPSGPYTALILAAAGLIRMDWSHRITAFLSSPVMMAAVGQGSLTLEVRKPPPGATPATNRDARILAMVQAIGDWRSTWRQEAERSLLRELEGGCSIPVGVESRFDDHDEIEGRRREQAAVRRVDIGNGKIDVEEAPIVQNGHTIPSSQLADRTARRRSHDDEEGGNAPPPLKRLATDKDVNGSSSGTNAGTAVVNGDHVAVAASGQTRPSTVVPSSSDGSSTVVVVPEDLATEPKTPVYLSLTALVVSLDGTRHCEYTMRRQVGSLHDAQQLGIDVAHELAHKRGARIILDEVERHRKLAEEADDKRRQMEREKRAQASAAAAEASSSPTITNTTVGGSAPFGESDEERENRRHLEELLRKSVKMPASVWQQAPSASTTLAAQDAAVLAAPEIDRRGLPRDDGQPKAWEV